MSSFVEKISPEIDYTNKLSNHSSPLFVKLNPINNVTTFTLSLTSTYGPVEFLIPSKVLNLSRSKMYFDLLIPAQGAGNFNWLQGNMLTLFDRMVITSQNTNQVLMDIPNFSRFASMTSPILTSRQELHNKSSPFSTTSTTATPPIAAITQAAGSLLPCEDVSRSNGMINYDGNAIDYLSPYHGIRKTFIGASAAIVCVSVCFDLSAVNGTILDLDKLLYFSGEQLLISLYFSPVQKIAWFTNSGTNPSTGATALTGNCTISNPAIYLYTEQNLSVSSALVEKVNKTGFSIQFPYPFIQRQAVAAGSFSITQQLTRGFGSKLLYILVSPFNTTESNNTAQDHSIATFDNGATSMNYNTFIDNIPIITNNNIAILGSGVQNAEWWYYNKNHLLDSSIHTINNYNIDFAHIDNFCSDPLNKIDWTAVDGLSLDAMHQYSFVCYSNATVANNMYLIFCCQKTLNFTPAGIQIS